MVIVVVGVEVIVVMMVLVMVVGRISGVITIESLYN